MLQLLSFVMSALVIVISIGAIVATIRAELPDVLRALGAEPAAPPKPLSNRSPRLRVSRPSRPVMRPGLRAAA